MKKYIIYPLIIVSFLLNYKNFPFKVSNGLPVAQILDHDIDAVPIVKVGSEGLIHRFHDTSPISPSGKIHSFIFAFLFKIGIQNRGNLDL